MSEVVKLSHDVTIFSVIVDCEEVEFHTHVDADNNIRIEVAGDEVLTPYAVQNWISSNELYDKFAEGACTYGTYNMVRALLKNDESAVLSAVKEHTGKELK